MADWSLLPKDLLHLISKHLPSETDLLRFRSVCSTWRTSTHPTTTPSRFPILPNQGVSHTTTAWGFHLSKRTIYLLQSPIINPSSFLIKLDQTNPTRTRLLHPLSRSILKPLPSSFPNPFDFYNFRVFEMGHEYTLQYINYSPLANSVTDAGNLYMEKVAWSGSEMGSFVISTIHVSGKLVLFRSGDKNWSLIDDLPSPLDDVIFFNGVFYAVDHTGRTVAVDVGHTSERVSVVAESVFGGDKKVLVASNEELLLVDMYLSGGVEDDLGYEEGFEFYEEFDCYMSERTLRFEVFELDRILGKWVEMKNLGDKMLFLGENCAFSASSNDFPGLKGNCIFFVDHFCYSGREEDGVWKNGGIGVFDLESGSIGALANYSGGYSELFWPPPAWVTSASNTLEVGLNQLSI